MSVSKPISSKVSLTHRVYNNEPTSADANFKRFIEEKKAQPRGEVWVGTFYTGSMFGQSLKDLDFDKDSRYAYTVTWVSNSGKLYEIGTEGRKEAVTLEFVKHVLDPSLAAKSKKFVDEQIGIHSKKVFIEDTVFKMRQHKKVLDTIAVRGMTYFRKFLRCRNKDRRDRNINLDFVKLFLDAQYKHNFSISRSIEFTY